MAKAFFSSKDYAAVTIDKMNFHPVKRAEKKVIFIDGGNAELIGTPALSLQFMRVAWAVMEGSRRTDVGREETQCRITTLIENEMPVYRSEFLPIKGTWDSPRDVSAFDKSLSEGGRRIQPSIVGSAIRRLMEIRLAIHLCMEHQNTIIVLDGTLEAQITGEKEMLDDLFSNAAKNNNIVAGLAKTSSMITDEGELFIETLQGISPEAAWSYHPVADPSEEIKIAIVFAKLHDKSEHIFRVDVNDAQNVEYVVHALAASAADLTFPGYPYGLVVADRFARISNHEQELFKAKASILSGDEAKNKMNSVDPHEILDSM